MTTENEIANLAPKLVTFLVAATKSWKLQSPAVGPSPHSYVIPVFPDVLETSAWTKIGRETAVEKMINNTKKLLNLSVVRGAKFCF